MTINFICRASKARKDGKSPVELSIIINNQRTILSLDRKINSKNFLPSSQRVKNDKETNEYLDAIRKKCYSIETELIKMDNLNLETFISFFRYGIPQKNDTLLRIYEKHNKLYSDNVASGKVSDSTLQKYEINKKRLSEFLQTKNMNDIRLREITPLFVEEFQNFCLKKLKNNTTNKQLKMLKKILDFAVRERMIDVSPFKLKLSEEKLEYKTLSIKDVKYLIDLNITDKRIGEIRDLFCLQSLTGLSYSDMATLTKNDIIDDVIIKKRKKTDVQFVVPVLPMAKIILEKYEYQLPMLSNQKYNAYLKVLGDYAKMTMKLHSHLARHSFACILLNSGVDMKTISRSLGHSTMKTTEKIYAFMNDNTVVNNILSKIKI